MAGETLFSSFPPFRGILKLEVSCLKTVRYITTMAALIFLLLVAVDAPVLAAPREPAKSQDLIDSQRFFPKMDPKMYKEPAVVISSGRKIDFETVLNKPEWQRYAYKKSWHSSYWGGRFSYVPWLVHNALHRIFVTYPYAHGLFDFSYDVGIEEHPLDIKSKGPFDKLVVAVMQADVKGVYTLNNQIVIIASPKRTGLHIFTLNTDDIQPSNTKEPVLVQLTTEKGEEIDFAAYVTPHRP